MVRFLDLLRAREGKPPLDDDQRGAPRDAGKREAARSLLRVFRPGESPTAVVGAGFSRPAHPDADAGEAGKGRLQPARAGSAGNTGCGTDCGCRTTGTDPEAVLEQPLDRRAALARMSAGLAAGLGLAETACSPFAAPEERESARLDWEAYFQKNFRLMTDDEKGATVERLERMHELRTGRRIEVAAGNAIPGVLYGYAFNISKCRGYMDCVRACIKENNQDRPSGMAYIRIHEFENGTMDFSQADDRFFHEVPAAGHFYIGTQCFHCQNPPCVDVCPTQATWMEDDGIVVVDYNWCIGCRYCIAACPYDARRFNWREPVVPQDELNPNQHYLGNRLREKGVVEKCTFCIQRSRQGQNPACVEACPTGARIFGNLLDPNSDIRWVLANKKVFRLKEDLGTEPKFWYFMD